MKYEIELSNADLIAMLADALSVDLSELCGRRKETILTNVKTDQDREEEPERDAEAEGEREGYESLTSGQKYGLDRDLLYVMPTEAVKEKYDIPLEDIEARKRHLAGQIDLHKVAALKKAGWKPQQIADEFVCAPEWIDYVLEQAKGGKSGKGKKTKSEKAK